MKELNRSECVPFSFRLYAYYKVNKKLTDLALHRIIDKINPDLRSIETIDGKQRKREFYAMSSEDAYSILEGIAQIHGLEHNLVFVKKSKQEASEEKQAKEINIYSEENFINSNPNVKDVYISLKKRIVQFGDVVIEPKKLYVAFKRNTNFCDVLFRKNKLVVFINMTKGSLIDSENICEDISSKGHWGNGDYSVSINSEMEIDSLMKLIEQSYKNN